MNVDRTSLRKNSYSVADEAECHTVVGVAGIMLQAKMAEIAMTARCAQSFISL